MGVAKAVKGYLISNDIDYDVIEHELTMTTSEAAMASHISPGKVAKGVLIRGEDGYLVAVVPANRRVLLDELEACMQEAVNLCLLRGRRPSNPRARHRRAVRAHDRTRTTRQLQLSQLRGAARILVIARFAGAIVRCNRGAAWRSSVLAGCRSRLCSSRCCCHTAPGRRCHSRS